jgi:hypothetical protein
VAKPLSAAEHQAYVGLLRNAGAHARFALGVGVPQGLTADGLDDWVQARQKVSSVQQLGRYAAGRGRVFRPAKARALMAGLHAVLADQAFANQSPRQRDLDRTELTFGAGLREGYAVRELGRFQAANGLPRPFLFRFVRPRDTHSQIYATAANALVDNIAKSIGASPQTVTRQLLAAPPDQRFHEAARMMVVTSRFQSQQQHDYAVSRLADDMYKKFGRLERRGASFEQIGKRWKRVPRPIRGIVTVAAFPLWVVNKLTRATDRMQRWGQRRLAARLGNTAFSAATKSLNQIRVSVVAPQIGTQNQVLPTQGPNAIAPNAQVAGRQVGPNGHAVPGMTGPVVAQRGVAPPGVGQPAVAPTGQAPWRVRGTPAPTALVPPQPAYSPMPTHPPAAQQPGAQLGQPAQPAAPPQVRTGPATPGPIAQPPPSAGQQAMVPPGWAEPTGQPGQQPGAAPQHGSAEFARRVAMTGTTQMTSVTPGDQAAAKDQPRPGRHAQNRDTTRGQGD